MSKPFDYSKWDNIELSDDEEDTHPNIDKESWFRMKHRSRVEREENEAKDKANIMAEMVKANRRIQIIRHDLSKLKTQKKEDDDDSDDEDLDDCEGLETELKQLEQQNAERQAKLDEYEKNKKWNVDNMSHIKEERTEINPNAAKTTYTETGYAVETTTTTTKPGASASASATTSTATASTSSSSTTSKPAAASAESEKKPAAATTKPAANSPAPADLRAALPSVGDSKPPAAAAAAGPQKVEVGAMETYHEFTQKHADVVEQFMACRTLEESKQFLLKHGDVLLQENASNYLLLASLEDEMNGEREKMKLTARQSQITTNIAELAKTVGTHPGNVIQPFFARLGERKHLEEFLAGVSSFVDKIIKRAVVKKAEIDEQRRQEESATDLHDVPREERLGPGGLDPLEVIETLPKELVAAFESRDVEELKAALLKLDPADAEYHMKRCVDSGLWVAGGQ